MPRKKTIQPEPSETFTLEDGTVVDIRNHETLVRLVKERQQMTLREGQNRLREISKLLKKGESLSETDRSFLSAALASIADGGNAEVALEVKAKRGERKKKVTNEPLVPNATTIKAMRDARSGKTTKHKSLDALMADLHAGN